MRAVFTELPLWAWLAIVLALLLGLVARFAERFDRPRKGPQHGAQARVERLPTGVTVVIPPQPGVRGFVAFWTLLGGLFTAYVCVITGANALGWAMIVFIGVFFGWTIAERDREVATHYFSFGTGGLVRLAQPFRWRSCKSGPLSEMKISLSHKAEHWYFRYERHEDEVWGRITQQDAAVLESLGVPSESGAPDALSNWSLSSWLTSLGVMSMMVVCAYPILSPIGTIPSLSQPRLEGSFRADHAALGTWTLAPRRCLSGRERGFEGVLFRFSAGSAVRELRVDMEHPGAAVLEFVFVDPSKPSVRIAQSECERIDGKTEARVVVINGRDMDALEGELSLACARYKLEGKATYQGCLP